MSVQRNWGVYYGDHNDEDSLMDQLTALHVAPCIYLDGEAQLSDAHTLSPDCPCRPLKETSPDFKGRAIFLHHDPDHPGAMSEEDWQKRVAAQRRPQ